MSFKQFIKKYKMVILVLAILIVVLMLGYKYKEYILMMKNPKKLKAFITSFGYYGALIIVMLQVFQVIIFFIPGEVIQVTGGWIYGTVGASILSLAGITLGSTVIFLISKKYGKSLVEKFVPEKQLKTIEKALNSKRLNFIVFLIYLLPGVPKDSTIFVCGISKMSLKDFLIYSTLGRIPALVFSCYLGSSILSCSKFVVFFMITIIAIIFLLGIFKGEYFLRKLSEE